MYIVVPVAVVRTRAVKYSTISSATGQSSLVKDPGNANKRGQWGRGSCYSPKTTIKFKILMELSIIATLPVALLS